MDVVNVLLLCEFICLDVGKFFLDFIRISWVGSCVFEKNVFRIFVFVWKIMSGKKYYFKFLSYLEFVVVVCLNSFNYSVVKVG